MRVGSGVDRYRQSKLFVYIDNWRRDRDSNPGYAINVYSLSRGALSTTQPSLRTDTCLGVVFRPELPQRVRQELYNGALGGSRTPDLLVRSQMLYPAELPAHAGAII